MVVANNQPTSPLLARSARIVPVALAWAVAAAVLAFFAWTYLSNPKPGPYGMCYASSGRPTPCK